jgi:hypothetical protein
MMADFALIGVGVLLGALLTSVIILVTYDTGRGDGRRETELEISDHLAAKAQARGFAFRPPDAAPSPCDGFCPAQSEQAT